jgi:PAS domain S-box-containing protein
MVSLFSPAIRLMNQLKFPQKFLLVGLVVILPLSMVLSQYVSEINLVIDFAATEQLGLQYSAPVDSFLHHVQKHSGLIAVYAAGDAVVDGTDKSQLTEAIRSIQRNIEADIRDVDDIHTRLDSTLNIGPHWNGIKTAWQSAKSQSSSLTPALVTTLDQDVIHQTLLLLNVIANKSNLILDPEIDSYYVIDALVNKTAALGNALSGIRIYGANAATQGKLLASDRTRLVILSQQIQSELEMQRRTLQYVADYNPALGAALNAALTDLTKDTDEFHNWFKRTILGNQGEFADSTNISVDPMLYLSNASKAVDAAFTFRNLLREKANELLEARITNKIARRNVVILIFVVVLAAALYLFGALYLAIRRVINRLEFTSQQFIAGHIEDTLILENRDELAQVTISFNNIAREMTNARDRALAATHAARESENQLRATLAASPIPVVVVNRNNILRYVNPVAIAMFDLDITKNADSISAFGIELEDRLKVQTEFEGKGFVREMEVRFRQRDGSIRFGLISIEDFQLAGESAVLVAIVDITDLKRAQEAERKQHRLTEALLDSVVGLTSSLELDSVVQQILQNLRQVIEYDVGNIMIIEGEYGIVMGQHNNIDDDNWRVVGARVLIKDSYYPNLMYQTRQAIIVGDISNDPKFVRISQTLNLKSFLALPIIAGQEIIGSMNLASLKADWFTQDHVKYLQIFALQAGIAIQNARLYEQARAISALEERQRLARDLHDSVTQTLFSANNIAEALTQLVTISSEKTLTYVKDLHLLTRGAMAEMRSLLFELRPDALTQAELGLLLGQLCDVFTGKTQIEVDKAIGQMIRLDAEAQIGFYRIAQEALNNIAKHAQASHVAVRLERTDKAIELAIRDDGIGLDSNLIPADHFGIKIMQERAQAMQATLSIRSGKQQGTEIILRRQLT